MGIFNAKVFYNKWFIGSLLFIYLLTLANYVVYTGQTGKYTSILEDVEISERMKSNLLLQQHKHKLYKQENATNSLKNVKILCWILTMPANHNTRAIHVKNTWGKRCDKIIFMSSQYNESLPSIDLGFNETRNYLWGKTKNAFKYVYDHHFQSYGWFMKADDDTYVVMENLRYLLSSYDPDEDAIWFGSRFKPYNKQGYMSGGGGYVLSRQALRLFVEKSLPNPSFCKEDDTGAEDAEMGKCLNNVGVVAGDSRDSEGRGRFFPFSPAGHVVPDMVPYEWYTNYKYYDIKTGPECCSNLAISFHYIDPKKMYELDYLIYHLHPFGFKHTDLFPPPLPNDRNSTTSRLLREYYAKTKGLHELLEKYDRITFIKKNQNDSDPQTSTTVTTTNSDFKKNNETPQNALGSTNSSDKSPRIVYVFVTTSRSQKNESSNYSTSSPIVVTTDESIHTTTPNNSNLNDTIVLTNFNDSVTMVPTNYNYSVTTVSDTSRSSNTVVSNSEIVNVTDYFGGTTTSAANFNVNTTLASFISNGTNVTKSPGNLNSSSVSRDESETINYRNINNQTMMTSEIGNLLKYVVNSSIVVNATSLPSPVSANTILVNDTIGSVSLNLNGSIS